MPAEIKKKKRITLDAPCKINLFLEVTGKRQDGYHEIDTVMQTVGLSDRVTVTYDPEGEGIVLSCQKKYIPRDQTNIAWRCAEVFLKEARISGRVEIALEKRIPVAAGLGGGSTDGAAVLKALNVLTGADFSLEKLCEIGAAIGADIPFCIVGGCMRATGIGERFSSCPSPVGFTVLVAIGGHGSSTPAAYKAMDDLGYRGERSALPIVSALEKNDHAALKSAMYNAFEEAIFQKNKDAEALKKRIEALGAYAALMSGSGASVFGLYHGKNAVKDARRACRTLREEGCFAVVAPVLARAREKEET